MEAFAIGDELQLDGMAEDRLTRDGFARWVEPHWAAMAALAARAGADGEDVLQDALASAWRKRRQFDARRGTARNWLLAITADARRKHWRSAARLPTPVSDNPAVTIITAPETAMDLDRALAQLGRKQRLAVELHYYLGLPVADAAKVLRVSEGTLKSNLSDARRRLKEILGKDY
ncbi:MAG: RNA polymerase sigma factor [Propionibacteriaceae bacterium]|nr:RNA polymerase sigma factor [Propionibacteriaceae bacterium]